MPSNIFMDFHRRRSCLIACEFETFTLWEGGGGGGGGGGDLPQLAQPNTRDFYYYSFLYFQLWTVGLDLGRCLISEPITLIHQEW